MPSRGGRFEGLAPLFPQGRRPSVPNLGWSYAVPSFRRAARSRGRRSAQAGARGQATLWRLMTEFDRRLISGMVQRRRAHCVGLRGRHHRQHGQSRTPRGSAYVLLHQRSFGESSGKTGAWWPCPWQAGWARSPGPWPARPRRRGPGSRRMRQVAEVTVRDGRATGVALADGRRIGARAVAGSVNPKVLYLKLLDPALLPDRTRRRIEGWRCRSGTLPDERGIVRAAALRRDGGRRGGAAGLAKGTSISPPSLPYLEKAYDDARVAGWPRRR